MDFWLIWFSLAVILIPVDLKFHGKSNVRVETKWPPKKPIFEWQVDPIGKYPMIEVDWKHCERIIKCDEIDEITTFFMRYKMLESKEWLKTKEYEFGNRYFFVLPGRIYELIGISKIGALWNESEPIEVFYPPACGPVHSVRFIRLSNTSLLISWKPPLPLALKQVDSYQIRRADLNNIHQSINFEMSNVDYKTVVPENGEMDYVQEIISSLKQNTLYRFLIFPRLSNSVGYKSNTTEYKYHYGLEYVIDYHLDPRIDEVNLPLTKPEFACSFEFQDFENEALVKILWYPGGRNFDFKGTRPGSGFKVQVKNGIDQIIYDATELDDSTHFIPRQSEFEDGEFVVVVMSIDGVNTSEAVSKKIKIVEGKALGILK